MQHQHRMAFYWDTNLGDYLFPGLDVNGLQGLLLLSLVVIFLTVIYEAIKVFQTQARARTARERLRTAATCPVSETANLLNYESQQNTNHNNNHHKFQISKKFITISGQAILFLFQNTLGYILMLSVMVYNGYLFIVVVFGLGLGYFLFGHISMRINMENIRARTTNTICQLPLPKCPSTEPATTSRHSTTGYINEMVTSSTTSSLSSSSLNDHCNKSNITESSQLEQEVEIHPGFYQNQQQQHDTSNIIQSCRL